MKKHKKIILGLAASALLCLGMAGPAGAAQPDSYLPEFYNADDYMRYYESLYAPEGVALFGAEGAGTGRMEPSVVTQGEVTTVSGEDYTVEIPASLNWSGSESAELKFEVKDLAEGCELKVDISSNGQLTGDGGSLAYTLDDTYFAVSGNETKTVAVKVIDSAMYSGSYSDTLTFTITCDSTGKVQAEEPDASMGIWDDEEPLDEDFAQPSEEQPSQGGSTADPEETEEPGTDAEMGKNEPEPPAEEPEKSAAEEPEETLAEESEQEPEEPQADADGYIPAAQWRDWMATDGLYDLEPVWDDPDSFVD